jgi:hypothetical protein
LKTLAIIGISRTRRFGQPGCAEGKLEFCDCFETAFKIAFSIRIEGEPDRAPSLICSHLRIQFFFVPETSLCPAQDLEVDPAEADLLKFLLDVPPQKIIPRQKRAAFLRTHQTLRARIDRDPAPTINNRREIGRQRGLPSSPLGFGIIEKPAIDTLSNLNHFRVNPSPTKGRRSPARRFGPPTSTGEAGREEGATNRPTNCVPVDRSGNLTATLVL